jgi:flavin-dependent dehydrogenase
MGRFDAIVVGGGPAGSTCAWRLVGAGWRVLVIDRARFPRDKVCAGWITPPVVNTLELDLASYAQSRALERFTGFETAIADRRLRRTVFDTVVSYGIRRVEFDAYLLARSGATVIDGECCRTLDRGPDGWTVNGCWSAPVLVGAGGHFCPVARLLNPDQARRPTVVAQEIEFAVVDDAQNASPVCREYPMLMFDPDLLGYGWCVKKGDFLNVGLGRLGASSDFANDVRAFRRRLIDRGVIPPETPATWKGHAYRVASVRQPHLGGNGVLLVGDAAGLALAPSGEGILAAVESGTLAASALIEASADRVDDAFHAYDAAIRARFGPRGERTWLEAVPASLRRVAGRLVFGVPPVTRRLVVENGFLHTRRPRLGTALRDFPHLGRSTSDVDSAVA